MSIVCSMCLCHAHADGAKLRKSSNRVSGWCNSFPEWHDVFERQNIPAIDLLLLNLVADALAGPACTGSLGERTLLLIMTLLSYQGTVRGQDVSHSGIDDLWADVFCVRPQTVAAARCASPADITDSITTCFQNGSRLKFLQSRKYNASASPQMAYLHQVGGHHAY